MNKGWESCGKAGSLVSFWGKHIQQWSLHTNQDELYIKFRSCLKTKAKNNTMFSYLLKSLVPLARSLFSGQAHEPESVGP